MDTLKQILCVTISLPHPEVFKALYLFAFFGFFRISNLAATSSSTFDINKQLCVGDVILAQAYAIVVLKWTKTLQKSRQGSYVMLPILSNGMVCP